MLKDESKVREAKAAILANLRDRRLLKWLFKEDADTNSGPIGYVDGPIDEATQDEIAESLVRSVLAALPAPEPVAEDKAQSLIAEAARLVAPAEGEAVFYVRVGGQRTHMTVKTSGDVDPDMALQNAIAALNGERKDLSNCPVHMAAQAEASTLPGEHPDDVAVDLFAVAMKAKLAKKREQGRGGWNDRQDCPAERLSEMLRSHVEKGDPLDVGNFAMMLHQRGERITPPTTPAVESGEGLAADTFAASAQEKPNREAASCPSVKANLMDLAFELTPGPSATALIKQFAKSAKKGPPAVESESADRGEETEVTFEVWEDDMLVASSTDEADARHYLAVYSQDGPVKLVKAVTTRAAMNGETT